MKLLAISGYSGSGKTTLLKKLIPLLKQEGLTIALIKHAHHDIDIDIPGKDSYELRKAGAEQTIVACDNRWALMTETRDESVNLYHMVNKLEPVDLVLIEGFKDEIIPKLICHRQATNTPLYTDENTLAVISDDTLKRDLPLLDINNINQVKQFIMSWLQNIK